jgi:hypothetical protein
MKRIVSVLSILAMVATTSMSVFAQDVSLSETDLADIEQAKVDYEAGTIDAGGSVVYNLAMDVIVSNYEHHRHPHYPPHRPPRDPSAGDWVIFGVLAGLSVASMASWAIDNANNRNMCVTNCTSNTGNTFAVCNTLCDENPLAF